MTAGIIQKTEAKHNMSKVPRWRLGSRSMVHRAWDRCQFSQEEDGRFSKCARVWPCGSCKALLNVDGIDINQADKDGWTPLFTACWKDLLLRGPFGSREGTLKC